MTRPSPRFGQSPMMLAAEHNHYKCREPKCRKRSGDKRTDRAALSAALRHGYDDHPATDRPFVVELFRAGKRTRTVNVTAPDDEPRF